MKSFDIDREIEAEDHPRSCPGRRIYDALHSRSSLSSICRLSARVSPARNEGARDSCVRMEERGEISLTPLLAFSRGTGGSGGGNGESASLKF